MIKRIQGTIEMGVPLLMVALLGGIALSNFWADIPMWVRVISVVLISIAAIAGFSIFGKPGGMGSMQNDDE